MSKRKQFTLVATTFDKKGRAITTSTNNNSKTHPLQKHFSVLAGESPEKAYLHAETAAMLQSGKAKVHSVLVQRFNNDGSPAMAKPCLACQGMLRAFGVRLVQYTTNKGVESYENL